METLLPALSIIFISVRFWIGMRFLRLNARSVLSPGKAGVYALFSSGAARWRRSAARQRYAGRAFTPRVVSAESAIYERLSDMKPLWRFPTPHRSVGRFVRCAVYAVVHDTKDGMDSVVRTLKRCTTMADLVLLPFSMLANGQAQSSNERAEGASP